MSTYNVPGTGEICYLSDIFSLLIHTFSMGLLAASDLEEVLLFLMDISLPGMMVFLVAFCPNSCE